MAAKWTVKEEEPKEYRPAQGRTDFNIPMLGYRSALFIFLSATTLVFLVPEIMKLFFEDFRWSTVIVTGILMGLSIAFSQYHIERRKKADRGFYILWGIWAMFMGVLMFLFYFGKMIL